MSSSGRPRPDGELVTDIVAPLFELISTEEHHGDRRVSRSRAGTEENDVVASQPPQRSDGVEARGGPGDDAPTSSTTTTSDDDDDGESINTDEEKGGASGQNQRVKNAASTPVAANLKALDGDSTFIFALDLQAIRGD